MKTGRALCALACLTLPVLLAGCAGWSYPGAGGGGKAVPVGVSQGVLFGDVVYPCFINSTTRFQIDRNDFEIIKTVTAEASSTNVLGLVGSGDNGYAKLFAEARSAGADDVINIKTDTRLRSFLGGFWKSATTQLTGTAIRWKKR